MNVGSVRQTLVLERRNFQDGTTAGHSVTASPGKAPWRSQPSVVDPGAPSKHFSASSCCHVPGAGTLASRAPPTRRLNPEDLASMLGYLPNITLPDSRQCMQRGWVQGHVLHGASPTPGQRCKSCRHRGKRNGDAPATRG